MNPVKKKTPANFREIAEGQSVNAVCKALKAHCDTVKRWFAEHDMEPNRFPGTKPRLDPGHEFDTLAITMTNEALGRHFKMSSKTIVRLRKARGVFRIKPSPAIEIEQHRIARRRVTGSKKGPQAAPDLGRDDSPVGLAAEHLRMPRGGGWAVNRCDQDGTFNARGDHFRVGNMTLTGDAMIAMASRKGWQRSDIWKVAA